MPPDVFDNLCWMQSKHVKVMELHGEVMIAECFLSDSVALNLLAYLIFSLWD
jgi:hypothetical protein